MAESTALRLADQLIAYLGGNTAAQAAAELRRLHHNNQVLKDALWKACGDDEEAVNATIASEGELKLHNLLHCGWLIGLMCGPVAVITGTQR